MSEDNKVEIEDTTSRQEQETALDQLKAFVFQIGLSGILLWGFVIGSAALEYFVRGTKGNFVVLLVAEVVFIWRMNVLTALLSNTTCEGRPFVRFMMKLSGFDNYRMLTGMAMVDLSGKFTRASFVAHALTVSDGHDADFVAEVRRGIFSFAAPAAEVLGIGGVAAVSFAVGTLLLQGGLLLRTHLKISTQLAKTQDREATQSMGISSCIDDFSTLADLSCLAPVEKIFSLAAIPYELEDANDSFRIWDQMKTETFKDFAHILPDTLVSIYLQVALFDIAFDGLDNWQKGRAIFSLFFSWAGAMNVARGMLQKCHLFPIMSGLTIIIIGMYPFAKVCVIFS